jgi:D-glycero-alpha-D-manno-heptose-7-phosphate kinase
MFYLGSSRSANEILSEQRKNMVDSKKIDNLLSMCALAEEMKQALENSNLSSFGAILDKSWQLKKSLASGIANSHIDTLYEKALNAGASGGKLLGAGGSGFLLFFCEQDKQERLRLALGLRQIKFSFDNDGTSVVYIGEKYWE